MPLLQDAADRYPEGCVPGPRKPSVLGLVHAFSPWSGLDRSQVCAWQTVCGCERAGPPQMQ